MEIEKFINQRFPMVHPYEGINAVDTRLINENFLVVMDDGMEYMGILTPSDLIKRPHKLVIDCITEKGNLQASETITEALEKFEKYKCSILPAFKEGRFVGIVYKNELVNMLRNKITELYKRSVISQNVKTSFLQSLSHEIRTPLNWILGFLEIISDMNEEEFRKDGKDHFEIVQKSADKFLLIISDLINISIINSGDNIRMEYELVAVEDIFDELKIYFEKSTPILLNREVQIQFKRKDISTSMYSDGNKIKHILYHLIDNAIKHSQSQTVEIDYHVFPQSILIRISNQGLPIPEEQQNRLFEIFEKQDIKNNDYMSSGLGVGLSLVKKLIELLEGNISFMTNESQTTFSVSIPYIPETDSTLIVSLPAINKENSTAILPVNLSI